MLLFIQKLFVLFLLVNNVVLENTIANIVCTLFPSNSNKVSFYLYTKSIYDVPVTADENVIKNAPFAADSDTLILIVHGFGSNRYAADIVPVRKAFLSGQVDYSILMVDYHDVTGEINKSNVITEGLEYIQAVKCDFPIVATAIYEMVEMIQRLRPKITYIRMVGHSLGAQLIGEAGNKLMKIGKPIHRLCGLDPAGPLFSVPSITADSAIFVDLYHTQIAGSYGETEPSGTVDFYVNNAVVQDGCVNKKPHEMALKCSHSSALYYFADSIQNNNIMASRCDEIKDLVKDVDALNSIDENNNNVLSSTCSKVSKLEGNRIVFGEYISLEAKGVYFVRIANVSNSS